MLWSGLGLLLAETALAVGRCEYVLATGSANNPPYLWRDPQQPDRLIGANADLLRQITDSLGLRLDIVHTGNTAKALEEVRSGRIDILADARLIATHLTELDFVHPAIADVQIVAWFHRDRDFYYGGREHLAGHPGVYLAGSEYGETFGRFAWAYLKLSPVRSLRQAFDKLAQGEVQYVLHERRAGQAQVLARGLDGQVEAFEPPVLEQSMHFALSQDSSCNDAWLRGQLAVKMTELQAAGIPRKLLDENLERWRRQQIPDGATNP